MIADPYPVIDPRGGLTPIAMINFHEVELRVATLNEADPQPPGYRYRLPLSAEYDPWVERRSLVVPDEAYKPWNGAVDPFPVTQTQQGISYYKGGIWFHVGGSVYCWCGDPLDPGCRRSFRGGSRSDDAREVRAAYRSWNDPSNAYGFLGYRLVRGPDRP